MVFKKLSYEIKKQTDHNDLRSFLKSLRPLKTELELIRIGRDNDSGYICPNDFENITTCFSPGVEQDSTFEKQLSEKYGIKSILADYSVDKPGEDCTDFTFYKKFIGYGDEKYITLENLVRTVSNNGDKILQMDIEGGEYEVIIDTSREILREFRIICIEFHEFDKLMDRDFFRMVKAIFNKLFQDFYIVHIHPNNISKPIIYKDMIIPPTLEFTFIRKDRVLCTELTYHESYPLDIDMNNCPKSPPLPLPKCFFGD